MTVKTAIATEVFEELKELPAPRLREVLTYIYFLKAKATIDPSQLYFWTRRWQVMERQAEADKRAGRIVGDGTLPGLLRALKRP